MTTHGNTNLPDQSGKMVLGRLSKLVFRALVVLLFLGLIIFFVVMPVGFGIAATNLPHQAVGAAPEGFTNTKLTTADGVQLAAWYGPPQNGAVIVLVHGASASREAIRPYAALLAKNGFGVLAFDMRGQGESGGQTNLYGWEGSGDVAAAMQFLSTQKDVRAIGGLGLSLGAEVLLGAASANPAMTAIVSEGASHRSMAEFRALPSHANLVRGIQPWVTYTTVRLLTGQTPPITIADSIKGPASTHFLLIAAQDTADEGAYAGAYADAASGRAERWDVPTGGHIGSFSTYPDEYKRRVMRFFKSILLIP